MKKHQALQQCNLGLTTWHLHQVADESKNLVALTASIDKEIDADGNGYIQIFPAGRFYAKDNRKPDGWKLTKEIAESLIATAQKQEDDYLIDYEHQTLYAASNGKPVIAAGWFKNLEYREDEGLFAKVKWNAAAVEAIKNDEYRYISPTFEADKDGNVVSLFNVALTNVPAIDGMAKVVALSELIEAKRSRANFLTELKSLVDSATGLSEDQLVGAVREMINQVHWLSQDQTGLEAPNTKNPSEAKTDNQQDVATPDPSKFVPIEMFNEVKEQLGTLLSTQKAEALNIIVEEALQDGKLTPAQKSWALTLGQQNLESLKQYISSAPVLTPIGRTQSGGKQSVAALSQDIKDKAFQMNMSPEEYVKYREKVQ